MKYLFRTVGISEQDIIKILSKLHFSKNTKWNTIPFINTVDIAIETDSNNLDSVQNIRNVLANFIFSEEQKNLEEIIAQILWQETKTVAVAESCSGGYLSHLLTNISDSSKYFQYSVTSYSNESKISILGVSQDTIKKLGAVSEKCAKEMARGVRLLGNVDIGISTTGISGPKGATAEKPLGLLYVGYDDSEFHTAKRIVYPTERITHKKFAAFFALELLWRCLTKKTEKKIPLV